MKLFKQCSVLLTFVFSLLALDVAAAENDQHWIATWGASPFGFQAFGPAPAPAPFVNQTLRQKLRISVGGEFDGVIDFEAAIRDDANPRVMKAEYDAGYKQMADSIDPALFR